MNSCTAISEFEAPRPARRAICASRAVRASRVCAVRLGARSPVARSSIRARSANAPAALAAQPLAVEQLGAGQLDAQASASEAVDRLAVKIFRGLIPGQQRAQTRLGPQRPVSAAGARGLREQV